MGQRTDGEGMSWPPPFIIGPVISILGGGLIAASAFGGDTRPWLQNLAVIGAGAVILGLIFPYVKSLKLPGGIEAEIRELRRGVKVNAERISLLSLLAMSRELYAHLKNLREGGKATKAYWVKPWVRVELEHLRNVGYIAMVRRNEGIRDIPADEPVDLATYVRITPIGVAYVDLRTEIEKRLEEETPFGAEARAEPGASESSG